MTKRNHYIVKLGKGNFLADFFFPKEGEDNSKIAPHIVIGHGSWKVADPDSYLTDGCVDTKKVASRSKSQIEAFFNHKDSFYWVFHKTKIYALQADSKAYDLDEYIKKNINPKFTEYCHPEDDWQKYENSTKNKNDGKLHIWSDAKLFKAKLAFPPLECSKVINTFASTNANRHYNSRTISELKNDSILYDVAESIIKIKLLGGEPKNSNDMNFEKKLEYLSPTQFETFVFLTLYELGYFPSSYRGGTGKDYDILIYAADKNISKKLEGKSYISVKLKSSQTHSSLLDKTIYIFGIYDKKSSGKNSLNILKLIEDLEDGKRDRVSKWVDCQISNLLPFIS